MQSAATTAPVAATAPAKASGAKASGAKKSNSKTSTIVLIAVLGGAAVLMAVVAAYAYNANKKKQSGGGGSNNGGGDDDVVSAYDQKPYNFYPGLDMIASIADQGQHRDSLENMMDRCSTTGSCVAFNDRGWFSSTILPPDQWEAHKASFGMNYGTHVCPEVDPYSERNSPDDPWVWYPGVSFDGAVTATTVAPAGTSLDSLRQTALDYGYAAFSPTGAFYATVTLPKGKWPVSSSASGVYVHRDHMPPDY
jgi:hypothetical protein